MHKVETPKQIRNSVKHEKHGNTYSEKLKDTKQQDSNEGVI